MRSIWKGHIRFSLVTIPIQVFSAVENKNNIRFNQLHREDHSRVSYKKVCRECETTLSSTDIVKGYEYEPDQYVVFEKDDFDAIKLDSTRIIDIENFVQMEEVNPKMFEAVYFIGPNGDVASKTFQLFCKTLENADKAGVGRIILRDREDIVLLSSNGKMLTMYKLRFPYELRDEEDVPDIKEETIDKAQLKLAETLVESMTTSFEEIDFKDRYRDALLELVDSKVAGKEIFHVTEAEPSPVAAVDIMTVLKESIAKAKASK